MLTQRKYARLRQVRLQGVAEYGGQCVCCGETQVEFLTIDHIRGREGIEKEQKITGSKMWDRLKSKGWPKDNYQLLCFNCNSAKSTYGECPHQSRGGDVHEAS